MTELEAMAHILQTAIIAAVCENSRQARKWLLLSEKITFDVLMTPEPGGFIECCKALGINWLQLRRTVRGAVEIPAEVREVEPYS